MGVPAPVAPPPPRPPAPLVTRREFPRLRLEGTVFAHQESIAPARSATFTFSILLHAVLAAAVLILPLLYYHELVPARDEALRAFFVAPPEAVPPPPPPPPPAPSAASRNVPKPPPRPVSDEPPKFVAPIVIPEEIQIEEGLDLGIEGGVPGGVEGGVPGGVMGGIVGGLPQEVEPPPAVVVRVGGQIKQPTLIQRVPPVFPPLALQARASAIVIIEAHVGTDGRVMSVRLLRGSPLFDDAALAAVKQWRYQPLLLNGVPTQFLLTVTVNFRLEQAGGPGG